MQTAPEHTPPLVVERPPGSAGKIIYIPCGEKPDGMNAPSHALDDLFAKAGLPQVLIQKNPLINLLGRALGRYRLNRQLVRFPGRAYLTTLVWANDGRTWPFCYAREIIPWIYDCWPRHYDRWEHLFRRHRTRLAFFSARGSADHFSGALPGMTSLWVPEACTPEDYQPARPLADRSIHVLELGRKHAPFHSAIAPHLAASPWKHTFSQNGTQTMLFQGQDELVRALGDTAISVCFPRTITHPDLAGGLETVTLRYFESIASGCLLIGTAPAELVELFGYNPVIEIDRADPWPHLRAILSDLPAHQHQVDCNLRRLHEVGTYAARAREILEILKHRGWDIGNAATTLLAR